MEFNDIKKFIETAVININSDKIRLQHIINSIDSGDIHLDINDKLLGNLSKIELDNDKVEMAIEYISLILSNIESQKINNRKSVNEELIKILAHNLETLRNLELCLNSVKNSKTTHTGNESIVDTPPVKKELLSNIIKKILPSNNVSNTIFWVLLFVIVMFAFQFTPDDVKDVIKTTKTLKEISNG